MKKKKKYLEKETEIFWLTCFGEDGYKYNWHDIFGEMTIQIYLN